MKNIEQSDTQPLHKKVHRQLKDWYWCFDIYTSENREKSCWSIWKKSFMQSIFYLAIQRLPIWQ